jgi:RNA polymerase sigma-70 factor, ECF subfamily
MTSGASSPIARRSTRRSSAVLTLRASARAVTIRALHSELKQGLCECLPGMLEEAALDRACEVVVAAVTERWPTTWVDGGHFGRYLARRIEPGVELGAALGELWIADLYLACATVAGVPGALTAFDRIIRTDLPSAVRTIDPSPDVIDEVLQHLREKLLVPVDGTQRLESYSGHGPLGGWLRVSALRIALSIKRQRRPTPTGDDELSAILDLAPNAEMKVLAQQIGSDLRAALRAALAAQPARTRAVLRMYYVDNHGVEDIGRVYHVHASTVSRWLAKARADILQDTRSALVARLATSQVDSLLDHAASLEISIESLLRSGG